MFGYFALITRIFSDYCKQWCHGCPTRCTERPLWVSGCSLFDSTKRWPLFARSLKLKNRKGWCITSCSWKIYITSSLCHKVYDAYVHCTTWRRCTLKKNLLRNCVLNYCFVLANMFKKSLTHRHQTLQFLFYNLYSGGFYSRALFIYHSWPDLCNMLFLKTWWKLIFFFMDVTVLCFMEW